MAGSGREQAYPLDDAVRKSPAYVYIVQAGDYIKIGVAVDVVKRFSIIRIIHNNTFNGHVARLRVIGARWLDAPYYHEKRLHTTLSGWRVANEWFLRNPNVMCEVYRFLDGRRQP